MTSPVLEVERLTVSLPRGADRAHAISNASFSVRPGELLCLVGESGSGKSIAAHTIMGLLPGHVHATAGRVRLAGEDLLRAPRERMRQLRGDRMSMIFQEPMTALNPVMTCGRQIDEVLVQHTRFSAAERRNRILAVLDRVRLPDIERIYASYPHQLSGGQRQRIMIAMATILRPALLIADEPTTALDVTTQAEVLRLIAELQREHNTAVLFITHDFGVVAEIADTVAVLQAGEVVEAGPCREVLVQPQHPYTRMLLQAVPDLRPRKTAPNTGAVRLTMSNVSKVFHTGGWLRSGRWVRAADSIDLEIRAGETLGIVGESGSGKSTVARLAACLLEPTGGHIDLDGTRIHRPGRHVERTFRRRVQIVFQDPYRSLNPRRTVGAAIMEGPINFGATRADARRRAAALMEMVKLSPASLDRYPHEFSGGQRQRICIARAIAVEPEVLIADEAVSALDVSVQAQILMLLDDLQQRLNLALVFITHDIRVAAQICHSLLVMHEGRVLERGPISTVFSQPSHEYTRRLFDAVPGRQYAFGSAT